MIANYVLLSFYSETACGAVGRVILVSVLIVHYYHIIILGGEILILPVIAQKSDDDAVFIQQGCAGTFSEVDAWEKKKKKPPSLLFPGLYRHTLISHEYSHTATSPRVSWGSFINGFWIFLFVEETFFTADILACHSRKSTGVIKRINTVWLSLFRGIVLAGSLSRLNGTLSGSEPSKGKCFLLVFYLLLWVRKHAVEIACYFLSLFIYRLKWNCSIFSVSLGFSPFIRISNQDSIMLLLVGTFWNTFKESVWCFPVLWYKVKVQIKRVQTFKPLCVIKKTPLHSWHVGGTGFKNTKTQGWPIRGKGVLRSRRA